jgi:hypothetical protein
MEEKIVYFETPGTHNTQEVLRLAKERAEARGITKIVLASTRGDTAKAALRTFTDHKIQMVVVPHQYGFGERQRFPKELKEELISKGHRVHFGTMLFHTGDLYGINTPTVMANLLRIFGQGIKVCVEIMLMACDGGLLEPGERVIAVSGTGAGADTAVVATSSTSNKLGSLEVNELICKPLSKTAQY